MTKRLPEVFGDGIAGQDGWVEVSPSTADVKGVYLLFRTDLTSMDGADMGSSRSRMLIFPKLSTAPASATQVSVINTTPDPTEATIALYDNNGQLVAQSNVSLPAFSGISPSLDQLAPAGAPFEGYAIVTQEDGAAQDSLVGVTAYWQRTDVALVRAFSPSA